MVRDRLCSSSRDGKRYIVLPVHAVWSGRRAKKSPAGAPVASRFALQYRLFGAVLDLKFLDQTMRIIHGFRVLGFGDPWAFSARLFVQPNIDKLRITHRS